MYRFLVFFLREQHVEIIQVHFHFLIKITMKNSREGGNILDRKKSGTNFHRGTISRNLVEEVGRFNNQWLIYTMKSSFEIRGPISKPLRYIYTHRSDRVSIFAFSAWRNSTRSVVNYTDLFFLLLPPISFSTINNRKFFLLHIFNIS